MNFEKMNQTPNSSLPLQGEVIDVTPINVEETKAIVLAKASENRTEILALTDKLDLTDTRTLVTFGKEAADEISKCSDTILNSVEMDKIEGAGQLMKSLTVIMDKFDVKELSEVKENFLRRRMVSCLRFLVMQRLSWIRFLTSTTQWVAKLRRFILS